MNFYKSNFSVSSHPAFVDGGGGEGGGRGHEMGSGGCVVFLWGCNC